MGFPCTDYCAFNVNTNFVNNPEELERRWKANEPMLENTVQGLEEQASAKRYFLFENPPTSALWKQPAVQRLLNLDGVLTGIGHQCAYGLKDPSSIPMKKAMRWVCVA